MPPLTKTGKYPFLRSSKHSGIRIPVPHKTITGQYIEESFRRVLGRS